MIPAALAVSFPCDLYGRATIACAAFAAEIAIAMAESSMQLANATGLEGAEVVFASEPVRPVQ